MYQKRKPTKTTLRANVTYAGETIENKIRRIMSNKEPITDGAPLIYTERKHGVQPAYNVRTDRFEIAVDAMDIVTKTELAKREARLKPTEEPTKDGGAEPKKDGGAEPIQGK